jgi:hypothetical protein
VGDVARTVERVANGSAVRVGVGVPLASKQMIPGIARTMLKKEGRRCSP